MNQQLHRQRSSQTCTYASVCWSESANKVVVHYLTSAFTQHAEAAKIRDEIKKCLWYRWTELEEVDYPVNWWTKCQYKPRFWLQGHWVFWSAGLQISYFVLHFLCVLLVLSCIKTLLSYISDSWQSDGESPVLLTVQTRATARAMMMTVIKTEMMIMMLTTMMMIAYDVILYESFHPVKLRYNVFLGTQKSVRYRRGTL